ncbi:hypothetical protein PROFUN_11499 [Planoprotostelium fungivorum]|uniref:Uncharacterized protein n=1 Tax=Planoprotostelium fungivorum TaxID=1890364 RepID=A0A2P6N9Z6_9EUKA|nr:hypothetical protein PROFUN_11499 [Planoprotostelium fungivorum]
MDTTSPPSELAVKKREKRSCMVTASAWKIHSLRFLLGGRFSENNQLTSTPYADGHQPNILSARAPSPATKHSCISTDNHSLIVGVYSLECDTLDRSDITQGENRRCVFDRACRSEFLRFLPFTSDSHSIIGSSKMGVQEEPEASVEHSEVESAQSSNASVVEEPAEEPKRENEPREEEETTRTIPVEVNDGEELTKREQQWKERKKADKDIDHVLHTWPMRLYMLIVWLVAFAVFFYYIYKIATQYQSNKENPTSSLSVSTVDVVPLPKVVICNWNQYTGSDGAAGLSTCPSCRLNLVNCTVNADNSICIDQWKHQIFVTPNGTFDCFIFNNDTKNPIYSNQTGYSGSYTTVWSIVKPPAVTPPINRAGVQASFIWPEKEITDADIFGEYRFAPYNFDTLFAIQWLQTVHQEDGYSGDEPETDYFDTISSATNLVTNSSDPGTYVSVSFAFQSLNVNVNTYFTSYTLENFWGDFAGMIGTLMGLDVLKVSAGIPIGYLAFKMRTLVPVEEHFNG